MNYVSKYMSYKRFISYSMLYYRLTWPFVIFIKIVAIENVFFASIDCYGVKMSHTDTYSTKFMMH